MRLSPNVIVSALITPLGSPYAVLKAARQHTFQLVISEELRSECARILVSPKLRRFDISRVAIDEVSTLFEIAALVSTDAPPSLSVRDPKDEMVLAAIGGRAEYLVTGDADLLELRSDPRLGDLKIITPREVADLLTSEATTHSE